jgi:hypothetical protein
VFSVLILAAVLIASAARPAPKATGDSAAPSARFWVSRNHRLVDQVLVWEPGASIM